MAKADGQMHKVKLFSAELSPTGQPLSSLEQERTAAAAEFQTTYPKDMLFVHWRFLNRGHTVLPTSY